MAAILAIVWFVALLGAIYAVFTFVGHVGLTQMFPEGKRWWHLPAQLASLAFFAAVVHFHPFGGFSL